VLHAGDAAGFVDPFVGDGISLALRGGALAAESLRAFYRGEASLEQAVAEYRRAYEERILPVFRASSFLRRLLALPLKLRWPVLRVMEAFPVIPRIMMCQTRERAPAKAR
jgi:flavin-dependent dehydrogenase